MKKAQEVLKEVLEEESEDDDEEKIKTKSKKRRSPLKETSSTNKRRRLKKKRDDDDDDDSDDDEEEDLFDKIAAENVAPENVQSTNTSLKRSTDGDNSGDTPVHRVKKRRIVVDSSDDEDE